MSAPGERQRQSGWALWRNLPRALHYLRPYRNLMGFSGLFTLLTTAVTLAEPWPLAIMVDSVLGDHPPADALRGLIGDVGKHELLIIAVLMFLSLTLLANVLTLVDDYCNSTIEQRMVLDLRSDLFEHAQKLSLTFHDARQTGALMSQINIQASAVGTIVMAFPPMIQALLTLVGMFAIALLIDWTVAVAALVVLPFLYWSFGVYGRHVVPRLQRVQELEWQSLSIVHEAMSMLRVIVGFGRERHEHRRFREQGRTAVDERIRLTVHQNLYRLGVTSVTAIGTALVLGLGAWHVLDGRITIGEHLVLLGYIRAVYQPLEQISMAVGTLHEQLVQFNGSISLLDTEPEVRDHPRAVALGRTSGHVQFEDVHFSYAGRAEALKGVTLEARPGERVAIVGPTGAGKTTLVSLLLRFYDPSSGRILLDGTDVRKIQLQSLRSQISVVLQEPLLFSGTIAENIRYGRLDATEDDVVAAARAASCHDFVTRLPSGYDTVLGERGAQLSGGERQRIAVARAFLRDAPILILDEPTSSIDSRTEGVILDALDDLMVGRTSFMIAHRLSTVRHADRIAVLSGGRIVEVGAHDELLAHEGLYAQLHAAQTRGRRRRRMYPAIEQGTP